MPLDYMLYETTKHGFVDFPIQFYVDDLYKFHNRSVPLHWHFESEFFVDKGCTVCVQIVNHHVKGDYILMKKDDILEKSRKENLFGDERTKNIAKTANENAYWAIMAVFGLLTIVALIQRLVTGSAFADYHIFILPFFIGWSGKSITTYIYNKTTDSLITSISSFIAAIACFLLIIL